MTLLDLKSDIVDFLIEKESFSRDDFQHIEIEEGLENRRDELITTALQELVKEEMLVKASEDFWILSEPFGMHGQDMHLSYEACNEIADWINSYLDSRQAKGGRCNPLSIDETDVLMLIAILKENLYSDLNPGDQNAGDN